jgi:hypothetical protein
VLAVLVSFGVVQPWMVLVAPCSHDQRFDRRASRPGRDGGIEELPNAIALNCRSTRRACSVRRSRGWSSFDRRVVVPDQRAVVPRGARDVDADEHGLADRRACRAGRVPECGRRDPLRAAGSSAAESAAAARRDRRIRLPVHDPASGLREGDPPRRRGRVRLDGVGVRRRLAALRGSDDAPARPLATAL